ncbi:MAG: hypothetical protein AAGB24_07615 [Bacteroidota bacterium]
MKGLIPTLMFFAVILHGYGQVERDKTLHFIGGNLYGLAGAGIAKQISDGNRYWTFAGAVGGSLAIGLAKEAVDAGQQEGGWDNDDLLATVLGGFTVGFTIDVFTDRKREKRRKNINLTEHSVQIFNKFTPSSTHKRNHINKIPLDLNRLSLPNSLKQPILE